MTKPFAQLRDTVRSDPTRAARVDAYRQAMDDALALAEIREHRKLTQSDIAEVLETSPGERLADRAAAGSLPVDAVTLRGRARRHPEGVGRLRRRRGRDWCRPRGSRLIPAIEEVLGRFRTS